MKTPSINTLRKRFIKDYNLPIQLVQNPYFSYYINLIDKDYNTIEKYKDFNLTQNTLVLHNSNILNYTDNLVKIL